MAKTYTATSVGKNHDWDFSVDDAGQITAMNVRSEVNYGSMGLSESKDIWPILNATQKAQLQTAYDLVAQWFNSQFI